jgi:two-component system, chemotaxis family, protein-glutamate methylesterase/glutaminase
MSPMPGGIGVLVVDDSPTVREFMSRILDSDPDIRVVGTARDGNEAIGMLDQKHPDILTMDVIMPGMDGYATTRKIMETRPTPIVLVSGTEDPHEVETVFRSMQAGALAILARPLGPGHPGPSQKTEDLIRTVKALAEVKVVRKWPRGGHPQPHRVSIKYLPRPAIPVDVVAIGASTGGPLALKTVLRGLPKKFPTPILIVQHMTQGFMEGFVNWLAHETGRDVRLGRNGDWIQPGVAYVAPSGAHMLVGKGGRLLADSGESVNGASPSVSCLFGSAVQAFGARALGVLLTGMGRDGAEELKRMREAGAVTIAQDKESSIVHGMPGEAIRLGAASYILSLEDIPTALERLVMLK